MKKVEGWDYNGIVVTFNMQVLTTWINFYFHSLSFIHTYTHCLLWYSVPCSILCRRRCRFSFQIKINVPFRSRLIQWMSQYGSFDCAIDTYFYSFFSPSCLFTSARFISFGLSVNRLLLCGICMRIYMMTVCR